MVKAEAKGTETETTAGTETGTDTEGEEEREEESRASGSSGVEWSGVSADDWTWQQTILTYYLGQSIVTG